jgi:hypothetical protein
VGGSYGGHIMKKTLILLTLLNIGFSYAEKVDLPPLPDIGPFTGLEATVGYIQKENGEKFMVIETPEGTRLVKVKKSPKELIEKNIK